MKTLAEIEVLAKGFAGARDELAEVVEGVNSEMEALRRRALPRIKARVNKAVEMKAYLKAAVDESRALFVKPRTLTMHGVKFGIEKGKGRIEVEDEGRTIKLIRKNLPDQAEALVKTEEYVLKGALKGLTVAELKSIGCSVEEAGDQVVIRLADRGVDKLVRALLQDAVEECEPAMV